MYMQDTDGIEVTVKPIYLEEQSQPGEQHYVWAYHIHIENKSDHTVQLLKRQWKITDALGSVEKIDGDGVVGERPTLIPGESYEYVSGAPLKTPSGIMEGAYLMETEDGRLMEVSIPAFSLDSPHEIASVH